MPEGPVPTLKAILVCDQVITEVGTSLIGVFEIINTPNFSYIHLF